jgi:hypothetical protein
MLPLGFVRSIFAYAEDEEATIALHRVLAIGAILLLLGAAGLAVRAIELARKDRRIRRPLAIAALLLVLLTPLVWFAEALLVVRVYVVRERLDRAAAEAAASSPPGE